MGPLSPKVIGLNIFLEIWIHVFVPLSNSVLLGVEGENRDAFLKE